MNVTLDPGKKLPFYEFFYPYEKEKLTLEYRLKQYHLAHPEELLDELRDFSPQDGVYQELLKHHAPFVEVPIKELEENFTIEEDFDLSITRHIRYLPAYAHTHQFFELAIVLEGTCVNYIGDQKLEMRSGDVCMIAPGTVHAVSAFSDECILLNCLIRSTTFEATFLGAISDQPVLSDFFSEALYKSQDDFYLLFHTGNDDEMRQILYTMYGEYIQRKKYCQKILNYYMSIYFSLLLRGHEQDVFIPNPKHHSPEYNFIYMLHYLQSHYMNTSLKEFAAFFNYSERQINRILHDYTGLGFSENVQKYKMEKAASLLKNPKLSISEITASCGYSNTAHFRTIFLKYYGETPVDYRKSHYN